MMQFLIVSYMPFSLSYTRPNTFESHLFLNVLSFDISVFNNVHVSLPYVKTGLQWFCKGKMDMSINICTNYNDIYNEVSGGLSLHIHNYLVNDFCGSMFTGSYLLLLLLLSTMSVCAINFYTPCIQSDDKMAH